MNKRVFIIFVVVISLAVMLRTSIFTEEEVVAESLVVTTLISNKNERRQQETWHATTRQRSEYAERATSRIVSPAFDNLLRSSSYENLMTPLSGCSMARWVATLPITPIQGYRDCHRKDVSPQHQLQNATQIQPYDTVYVPYLRLGHFLNHTLPHVQHPFVLITGQLNLVTLDQITHGDAYSEIVNHRHVVHWMAQQWGYYGRLNHSSAQEEEHHNKVTSFPYGLNPAVANEYFQQLLLHEQAEANDSTYSVLPTSQLFLSHVEEKNNPQQRQKIPQGVRRNFSDYVQRLAAAHYTMAPDGDRPECFRHYEALGLGTVPISQLLPSESPHLVGTGVLFETRDWNVTRITEELPPSPIVERRVIFEEYWMEYYNQMVVGPELCWWNRTSNSPSKQCAAA